MSGRSGEKVLQPLALPTPKWSNADIQRRLRNNNQTKMPGITIEAEALPHGGRLFRVEGALTRRSVGRLRKEIPPGSAESPVVVDLAGVSDFDSFGAVFLIERADASDEHFSVRGARHDLQAFVRRVSRFTIEGDPTGGGAPLVERLGQIAFSLCNGTRSFLVLGLEFFYWLGVVPFKGGRLYMGRTFSEIVAIGVAAIPIVLLVSLLMGVILALNAAAQLEMFGATIFVANLVGVAITKELGPVFAAILVAGRTGSAIAAELGTMIVTEEIDALRVMGINPRAYLVVPKILALLLIMPCLVIMADIVGIVGGLMIGVGVLNVPLAEYMNQTINAILISDVITGLAKSVVFGFLIGLTGASLGLTLRGGAEEVGRVTTRAVVVSFLLIIVADTVFTVFFTYLGF